MRIMTVADAWEPQVNLVGAQQGGAVHDWVSRPPCAGGTFPITYGSPFSVEGFNTAEFESRGFGQKPTLG